MNNGTAEKRWKTIVDFTKIDPNGVSADKVLRVLKKYLRNFNKK